MTNRLKDTRLFHDNSKFYPAVEALNQTQIENEDMVELPNRHTKCKIETSLSNNTKTNNAIFKNNLGMNLSPLLYDFPECLSDAAVDSQISISDSSSSLSCHSRSSKKDCSGETVCLETNTNNSRAISVVYEFDGSIEQEINSEADSHSRVSSVILEFKASSQPHPVVDDEGFDDIVPKMDIKEGREREIQETQSEYIESGYGNTIGIAFGVKEWKVMPINAPYSSMSSITISNSLNESGSEDAFCFVKSNDDSQNCCKEKNQNPSQKNQVSALEKCNNDKQSIYSEGGERKQGLEFSSMCSHSASPTRQRFINQLDGENSPRKNREDHTDSSEFEFYIIEEKSQFQIEIDSLNKVFSDKISVNEQKNNTATIGLDASQDLPLVNKRWLCEEMNETNNHMNVVNHVCHEQKDEKGELEEFYLDFETQILDQANYAIQSNNYINEPFKSVAEEIEFDNELNSFIVQVHKPNHLGEKENSDLSFNLSIEEPQVSNFLKDDIKIETSCQYLNTNTQKLNTLIKDATQKLDCKVKKESASQRESYFGYSNLNYSTHNNSQNSFATFLSSRCLIPSTPVQLTPEQSSISKMMASHELSDCKFGGIIDNCSIDRKSAIIASFLTSFASSSDFPTLLLTTSISISDWIKYIGASNGGLNVVLFSGNAKRKWVTAYGFNGQKIDLVIATHSNFAKEWSSLKEIDRNRLLSMRRFEKHQEKFISKQRNQTKSESHVSLSVLNASYPLLFTDWNRIIIDEAHAFSLPLISNCIAPLGLSFSSSSIRDNEGASTSQRKNRIWVISTTSELEGSKQYEKIRIMLGGRIINMQLKSDDSQMYSTKQENIENVKFTSSLNGTKNVLQPMCYDHNTLFSQFSDVKI